ncbi:MAG: hypothetical protein PHH98_01540 [Candidatus Gracilibacteria bacterium]|nr:hypothetical protein [Candidatus Gracilibacteria bacterium]
MKEQYSAIIENVKNRLFYYWNPYFLFFFVVTIITGAPILLSLTSVTKVILEPHFSIVTYGVVLLVTSGLNLVYEEYHRVQGVLKNKAEKENHPFDNDTGMLLVGFLCILLAIIWWIILTVIATTSLNNYKIIYWITSIVFFIFSVLSWIISNAKNWENTEKITSLNNFKKSSDALKNGAKQVEFTI